MIALSRNDYFVISDSDVEVGPDFLRNVVPPLLDPRNGLLTCVYRGVPAPSFWSSLEALGMSVEMTSGVLLADMLEGMRFALGAVIATKRQSLETPALFAFACSILSAIYLRSLPGQPATLAGVSSGGARPTTSHPAGKSFRSSAP